MAEELRRYYSELNVEEDDNYDKGITDYIKQFIRKVWSYR